MCTIRLSIPLFLLLGTIGCGKKDSTPSSNPKDATVPMTPSGESGAGALGATKFVKAVQDGKATSDLLTLAFKKVIASPELESDKAAGFSELGVQSWFASAKATAKADDLKVDFAAADYALVSTTGTKPGRVLIRMVKAGSSWLVDHARFNAQHNVNAVAAANLATGFFVEAVLAGSKFEIEALLSKGAKAKLAAPVFEEDKAQGFSRSRLNSTLADLFPAGTTFVSVAQDNGSLKALVTLAVAGKNRVLELKLAPGLAPGEFLVDDLQQK